MRDSFCTIRIVEEANLSSRSFSRRVSDDKANRSGRKGMVLPFQPLSLTFDEIKYSLDMPQEMKKQGVFEEHRELLKGVSGVFRPRVLTALMGVSGAGKTTLMDAIQGVPKIKEGYNPATWMLEVTSACIEASLKVNFTNVYRNSELYRLDSLLNPTNIGTDALKSNLLCSIDAGLLADIYVGWNQSKTVEALHAFIQDESEHNGGPAIAKA
ncbi:ABC transporter G family member 35 [Glycine soja]